MSTRNIRNVLDASGLAEKGDFVATLIEPLAKNNR